MKNTIFALTGAVIAQRNRLVGNFHDYKACLEDDTKCFGLPLARPRARSATADGLESCLSDPQGCIVETSSATSGTYETAHPYQNDAKYMFEVTLPEGGTSITWQFSEFEVDQLNDGTCDDEVYIFTPTVQLGPFCGFDDQFYIVDNNQQLNENYNYDYYYESMLGTHNLGNLIESITQVYPLRIGLSTGEAVNNWGFKLSWTTSTEETETEETQESEQPAAEQAIRIEKDIQLWGGFEWTAGMLDNTSTDYTTTHQLFVDFFNTIFSGIKTKYGYTLTVDITFVRPVNSGRKRRDADDQPGVIVVVSFNGESNVDVSALTLDLEIETAVTSAYTQMPDGFDGLIATSYPALMPNQVQIVNALGSTGCWTCESHTMEGCILNGAWEMCQSKDDNSDQLLNRFEPVCFVELRERDQRVDSIKTGCMDKHACQVHQRQNRMDGARKDFSQCRPEYRLINRRYAKEPSVCRQCFTACDVNGVDDDMCFGGMNSNDHASDDAKRADAKWIEYPSDMATTYWNSATQFSPAYLLGIPIGTSVTLADDLAHVQSSDNKVFWGQTRGATTGSSKTAPGTPGDEMVYWGLQDQTIDWWMSDLIAAQNVYYSRGTVDQEVFNPN